MRRVSEFRQQAPGFVDLLNYAAIVEDGVLVLKSGALLAAWSYRGDDLESSSESERDSVRVRVNAALARLGSGWMAHIDGVRLPAENYPDSSESKFPNPVTALIDAERRAQYEGEGAHFESQYVVSVTYMPPSAVEGKLSEYLYDENLSSEEKARRSGQAAAQRDLESFQRQLHEIEDSLSSAVRLHRLRSLEMPTDDGTRFVRDELLEWLQFCITGILQPMRLPEVPMYLDAVLGAQEFWAGITPKLGEHFIGALSIDGFPLESSPGMLAELDGLPLCFRWSTRFIFLDAQDSKKHLESHRKKWDGKIRSFLDVVLQRQGRLDRDALNMSEEVSAALTEASAGHVLYGFLTTTVILMDTERDRLEEGLRDAKRLIQNRGFNARVEGVSAVEAYLGSLPGHHLENVRRPMMHTLNLADLIPLSGLWAGQDRCPSPFFPPSSPPLAYCTTSGATPFRLNLHVGDVGHSLILGPTGSGKSTLLAFIVAQFFRYGNASVFAFDKGNSLYALGHCGGKYYEIAGEGKEACPSLRPLADLDTPADISWACDWVEMLVQLQGIPSSPQIRNEIKRALDQLAAAPRGERTITALRTTIQIPDLRDALEYYTIKGTAGSILDADSPDLALANFQVFEIEHLMNRGDKIVIPVLTYLFRRIEQQLKGQPAMIVLDEAWVMLGHPAFRNKIREWLKVLRKNNCCVVMATQSISDAANSGILDVLIEQCPTKIFLPNPEATQSGTVATPGPLELYSMFGLNERQTNILATARPKREYYFVNPEGRRLISLELGPLALSFVGASGKQDLATIRELIEAHGEAWWQHWLRQRNVEFEQFLK